MMKSDLSPLVIFDARCNLCHGAVNFIIAHDPDKQFRFCALQSATAQSVLVQHDPQLLQYDTVYLFQDEQVYIKSDAAIEIAKLLSGHWPLLRYGKWLPKGLRDGLYDTVARYRYRLFGQRPLCLLPDDETKSRFVE
ncbi:DCC1-like thiol-disulfide oxidoreductase family protein [Shewanella mesophila]|uniref:thiol-disulfide oxidoreductase DCC family protein n=1 Tax=Shewanella mesophila TaxID=2864208 RepID=UPI001C65B0D5|nr:DCC1-like thiol-disulfide oxidoreductase family protein [Shewanella mesophila]QYJ87377.1 DCC1-like thiol-disulfide oxidoreductase family protein [Shewanella mesophila]